MSIARIIITIVIIATIAVVYNSFQISVVERIKQFGLLRAVGATPKQIKKNSIKGSYFNKFNRSSTGNLWAYLPCGL